MKSLEKKHAETLGEELWKRYAWGAIDKYLIQTKKESDGKVVADYVTLQRKEDGTGNTNRPLLPFMLAQHIMQTKTYGVFSGSKAACFFCFDVDGKPTGAIRNQPRETYVMVEGVIEALIDLGIPDNSIATSWSGYKGFHIDIFFDCPTALWLLEKLYWFVLMRSGLEHMKQYIEPRPLPGHGVKLPLGKNLKNPNPESNICSFVNPFCGYQVIDDLDYIKGVPRVKSSLIHEIWERNALDFYIKDEKIIKPETTKIIEPVKFSIESETTVTQEAKLLNNKTARSDTIVSKRLPAIELLKNGLPGIGTRANAFVSLAAYFKKEKQLCKEDALAVITEWFSQQPKRTYDTDYDIALQQLNKIVNSIYGFPDAPVDTVQIYEEDINMALRLPTASAKSVYLAILIHARCYRRKDFFMTYDQLEKKTGFSRKTVAHAKKIILECGFLTEISTLPEARRGLKSPCCYRLSEDAMIAKGHYVDVKRDIIISKDTTRYLVEKFKNISDHTS